MRFSAAVVGQLASETAFERTVEKSVSVGKTTFHDRDREFNAPKTDETRVKIYS